MNTYTKQLRWLFIFLMGICLVACKVKRPGHVFTDAQMEDILYDYHIAKAMGENLPHSENFKRTLYAEAVFRKHNITEAEFDSSMVWYTRNPEILAKVYEHVNKRLKATKTNINHLIALRDDKPTESQPGDSIDVWAWKRVYQFTGMPLNNKLTFILPSDTNFKPTDTLRWNVRFCFLGETPDTAHQPWMAMQVSYAKDSIVSASQRINKDGIKTIALSNDSLGEIQEIRGFVYYPNQRTDHEKEVNMLIDSVSLMRYHFKEWSEEQNHD